MMWRETVRTQLEMLRAAHQVSNGCSSAVSEADRMVCSREESERTYRQTTNNNESERSIFMGSPISRAATTPISSVKSILAIRRQHRSQL